MKEQQQRQHYRSVALNPQSQEFQNANAIEEELMRARLAEGLKMASTRDRRTLRRGGSRRLFDRERQDQLASQLMSRVTAGGEGEDRTRRAFMAAAGSPDFSGGIAGQQAQDAANRSRFASGLQGGFSLAGTLGDALFGKGASLQRKIAAPWKNPDIFDDDEPGEYWEQ